MANKAVLVEMVEAGQAEMLRFARILTDEERSHSGTLKAWAHRDYLVHMTEWKRITAEWLAAVRQGQEYVEEDYLVVNDAMYEKYHDCPWSKVEELMDGSNRELLFQLQSLSEEDLNTQGRFPGVSGVLWKRIAGNGFIHIISHLGPIYIERGELEYVDAMRRREAALVANLDDSPAWQATSHYNLACHYALIGNKQRALELLDTSLRVDPNLIDWSQQDTDLVSLHNDPDFHALLERLKASRPASE